MLNIDSEPLPNADKGIDCPKMHIMATWLIENVHWVFVNGIQEYLRPQVRAYMNYAFNTFLSWFCAISARMLSRTPEKNQGNLYSP